tara:strand:- start:207 stop:1133 length:927 start_codon:yes stop_codon:yes gene_type:complete
MIDFSVISRDSKVLLQKLYDTCSKPSVHGDWFFLLPGATQICRLGRKNKSPNDLGKIPCGFMCVSVEDFGIEKPIMIEKHKLLFWKLENTDSIKIETKDSDTGSIMIHFENHTEEEETSINGFVSDSELEDLRIYRWLKDRTPPKGFFKVLSFNLYKRDIKNLKSYLPKELKKNNVLNLVYFLNDSDFKNKSSMIVFDEMNWIFSARGHVLFKDDSILSLDETVIQKGLNLKVHKKKHFPIISEFSPDLFLDIQEDNYQCSFYTDGKIEDNYFGYWYLKLDNQDGITYHFFSKKDRLEGDEKFFQLLK